MSQHRVADKRGNRVALTRAGRSFDSNVLAFRLLKSDEDLPLLGVEGHGAREDGLLVRRESNPFLFGVRLNRGRVLVHEAANDSAERTCDGSILIDQDENVFVVVDERLVGFVEDREVQIVRHLYEQTV